MVTALLVIAVAIDLARPPARQLLSRAALGGIHLYQRRLWRIVPGSSVACRFQPTCSRYAEVVIQRDGALYGGWRALARIARCNALTTPMGTRDEP